MATTVWVKCEYCHADLEVREADRKRGWGRFCDKSCKAAHQSYGPQKGASVGAVTLKASKPKKTTPTPKNMKKGGVTPEPRVSMKDTPKPENYGEFS